MTLKPAAASNTTGNRSKFPADAADYFAEVPEETMAALREQSDKLCAEHEWELVDGLSFPYAKSA